MKNTRRRRRYSRKQRRRILKKTRKAVRSILRGGSLLNAPNGSVVIVRDNGDKYSPFVAIDKQDAEKEDF